MSNYPEGWTFEKYHTDKETNPKSVLLHLINNENGWANQLVIIDSKEGNGGTHLLCGVYNELRRQKKNVLLTCAQKMLNTGIKFGLPGSNYSDAIQEDYLLIDDVTMFRPHGRYEPIVRMVKSNIAAGKKVILCGTRDGFIEILKRDFPNHLVVTSEFPVSFQARKKILDDILAHDSYSENAAIRNNVIGALAKHQYKSVREFLNAAIWMNAKRCVEKIVIEDGSEDEFVSGLMKDFSGSVS